MEWSAEAAMREMWAQYPNTWETKNGDMMRFFKTHLQMAFDAGKEPHHHRCMMSSTHCPMAWASADHSIASMDIGESGWTVPWAMHHDAHRDLWLNGSYTIHDRPGGTAQMLIRRDDRGWHVDASSCGDHLWGRSGYVGDFPPIAVSSLKTTI
jgi:hypothetical protein